MTKCLLEAALETPIIHMEDVYITGMLADKCGFQRQLVPQFYSWRINPCHFGRELLVAHYVTAQEQKLFYNKISKN